jgi:hypothetical protein
MALSMFHSFNVWYCFMVFDGYQCIFNWTVSFYKVLCWDSLAICMHLYL